MAGDLLTAQPEAFRPGPQPGFGGSAAGLGLGHPARHDRRIRARFEGGAVLAKLGVAVGDVAARLRRDGIVYVSALGLFEKVHGARELARPEQVAEPVIEAGNDQAFAQVHSARMADLVLCGVLAEEHAPVVGGVVVPAALHAPVADPAVQQPAQQVRPRRTPRGTLRVGSPRASQRLGALERGRVDERLVHRLLGPDPVAGLIPALLGGEPERDVVDVEQHLVFTLTIPHLAARVTGVAQDRGNRAPRPGDPAAMPVAGGVVSRWRRDPVPGECFGYGLDAHAREVVGEDPPDHISGLRVGRERVQPLAVRGLGRVRMRADVDKGVSVGRPAAEVAAFELRLGGHRSPDADLDPVPLSLRHPAEHGHDQVVGLVVGIDRPADLGHPQRHAVVGEQREGVAKLVAVERSLRFPHDHGVEPTLGVGERREQGTGLWPTLRRDRAGLVDVEELGDDLPAVRLDQRLGAGDLPAP